MPQKLTQSSVKMPKKLAQSVKKWPIAAEAAVTGGRKKAFLFNDQMDVLSAAQNALQNKNSKKDTAVFSKKDLKETLRTKARSKAAVALASMKKQVKKTGAAAKKDFDKLKAAKAAVAKKQ